MYWVSWVFPPFLSLPLKQPNLNIMINAHATVTYRSLLRYVKPYRLVFLLALLGAIIDAAMKGLFIGMLSSNLDNSVTDQHALWIYCIPFFVVGIFFVRCIGNFMAAYGFTWLGIKIIKDLRR